MRFSMLTTGAAALLAVGASAAQAQTTLTIGTVNYASVRSILITGLDRAPSPPDPITAAPVHDNIRGPGYYQ